MSDYYCPSCGEIQRHQPQPLISPGDHPWKCPSCGVKWRVETSFHEMGGSDAE